LYLAIFPSLRYVHYILLFLFFQHFSTGSPWRGGVIPQGGKEEEKK